VLLDIGQTDAGNALLERALAESARDDAMAGPHALALLERGLHRSRRGDMLEGQEDLLAACSALEALPLPQDLELCRSHLANHYKRMGDTDEALRLLEDLLEAARRRGATADVAVYVYGLAQVRYERREWQGAAEAFEESIRLSKVLDDPLGVAYAEHGLGHTLLRLNRPQQALEHAQHALRLLGEDRDPVQQLRTTILQANALSDLERFTQADTRLRGIENRVRDSKDATLLADWLLMHSEIQARLGQWKDAYESLAEWRPLNAQTQDQRLSQQTARLRLQFHRERDAAELAHLRRLNAKGDEALQAQRLALVLFLMLLAAAIAYGARKLRHMRKLQRLATVDELSGLPNRRASMAYLEDCLRRAHTLDQPLSVLMVDIDHFKSINDRHGHAKGDEVIREVARTLGGAVRLQDRAGRIGGEEFLVVLPGATTSHAQAIAERMRAGVQQLGWSDAGESDPVTVSIGVASRVDRDSAASLVTRADQALYAAKNQGRNRVVSMPPAP
jgi:diguanylate cyclase (GGDEF)-like protein